MKHEIRAEDRELLLLDGESANYDLTGQIWPEADELRIVLYFYMIENKKKLCSRHNLWP